MLNVKIFMPTYNKSVQKQIQGIIKAAREKLLFTCKGYSVRLAADFVSRRNQKTVR